MPPKKLPKEPRSPVQEGLEEFRTPELQSTPGSALNSPSTQRTRRARNRSRSKKKGRRSLSFNQEPAEPEALKNETSDEESQVNMSSNNPQEVDIVIDGVTIKASKVATTMQVSRTATYRKEDRAALSAEKKHDLFSKITKAKQQTEYQLLEPSIQDLDDLDKTHQLHMMLRQTQINFITYDLVDVFKIVFPIRDPVTKELTGGLTMFSKGTTLEAKCSDLFTEYNQLTLEQVADSSEWYQRFCRTSHTPWIAENFALLHINTKFLGKIDETLDAYKKSPGYGGPLIFSAMMHLLQQNTAPREGEAKV